jgi:simple sugar transport system ATP-binding protein
MDERSPDEEKARIPARSSIVEMRGVVKRFPGVVANRGVYFDLREGEIHALLGENGAGKTTLMNVLYGLYEPDGGEVLLRGRPVRFSSARDAIREGLGMVHQHFMLVQPFTVAENIVLGQPSPREPFIEKATLVHKRVRKVSDQYGLRVDPEAPVWTLSVGEQQRVEILKTLYRGAEILILDEPTAVLTPQEVDELLDVLKRMKGEGKSIVFISHKLREVLTVSDRVTVLRDGRVVDTVAAEAADRASLARMMVDRDVLLTVPKKESTPAGPLLRVKDLSVRNDRGLYAVQDASFEVRAGEILGVAGVAGNGQFELEEVIAGLRRAERGSIEMCGREITHGSPRDMGACGLAHIPSDRYRMGLLPEFSVAENLMLQRIGRRPFTRRGVLDWRRIHREAGRLAADFDVRTTSVQIEAGTLSGGNAQKMILARELARSPRVLLAAQPTRGLDVSAIESIHRTLIEQRDGGMAILLFSTELDEILTLSDRIAVMCGGRIAAIMDARDVDVYELGLLMGGVDPCACVGDSGVDGN